MMPRAIFWTLFATAVAIGLMIGSIIKLPQPRAEASPVVHAQFHPAGAEPESPPALVQGSDREAGWEKRQVLRDQLDAALQALKAKPCDVEARRSFLAAYIKRTRAQLKDDRGFGEGGAPFWRTSDDQAQTQSIQQLIANRWFTQDELGEALFRDALGNGVFKAMQAQGRSNGSPYNGPEPDRCLDQAAVRTARN